MGNNNFTRVTMNLTDRDVKNTDSLKTRTGARTKADVVSMALSLAKVIADNIHEGDQLCIISKDKKHAEKIHIPGITS